MNNLYKPLWLGFSKKLKHRIESPHYVGSFRPEEAVAKKMRLVIGKDTSYADSQLLIFYLLVDEEDGIIADAKFLFFGPAALCGVGEAVCESVIRKNYDQARRLSADLLDRLFRDKTEQEAFPSDTAPYLNQGLAALEVACEQCMDIPIAAGYTPSPLVPDLPSEGGIAGWQEFPLQQKIAILEEIISKEIRPYIELDAGGVKILTIENKTEVRIAYEGSCTSCYSATGATLNAIQQILQAKVDPAITVIPDLTGHMV